MTIETTMKHRYEIASAVEETNASKTFKAQDLTYQRDVFLKAISVPSCIGKAGPQCCRSRSKGDDRGRRTQCPCARTLRAFLR